MNIRGIFSSYDLSVQEKETFAEFLKYDLNTPLIPFLQYYLGEEGYLQFIDVFSGCTIKIPSMKALERDLEAVQIFLYLKRDAFSENSIHMAAKTFGKTTLTVRRYADKVGRALGVEDTLDDPDALNNYILFIKSVDSGADDIDLIPESKREEIDQSEEDMNLPEEIEDLDSREAAGENYLQLENDFEGGGMISEYGNGRSSYEDDLNDFCGEENYYD